jgi:hypothetical protein
MFESSAMKGLFSKNLALAGLALGAVVFVALTYLWTMLVGTGHEAGSLGFPINTRSGTVDVLCSLAAKLEPGHDYALNCSVKPRTDRTDTTSQSSTRRFRKVSGPRAINSSLP